jgi:hypothetical protein
MKQVFSIVLIVVLAMLCSLALDWIITGNEFFLYKFFGPKTEAVRRQIFENTKSYNQGMVQELRNAQLDYVKAKGTEKKAIASIILHETADYDESKLPDDLKQFIEDLKLVEVK